MGQAAKTSFGSQIIGLPVSRIVARREPSAAARKSLCFKQIAASLEHIGLIEPLVVFRRPDGTFLLVDGNTRFYILKSRGETEVQCIIALDDEAYTYNKRVSHVPPISQHFMLLRVLENGVSEERVAAALNVDLRAIRQKKDLIKGICPEVVTLLEGYHLSERAFSMLRKMKPVRQIESVDLMIASNNFSLRFLKAILLITKPDMLSNSDSKSLLPLQTGEASFQLEKENAGLVKDLKAIEKSFGKDMLTLAVSLKYLARIMDNRKVSHYLERSRPETFSVLMKLMQDSAAHTPAA